MVIIHNGVTNNKDRSFIIDKINKKLILTKVIITDKIISLIDIVYYLLYNLYVERGCLAWKR